PVDSGKDEIGRLENRLEATSALLVERRRALREETERLAVEIKERNAAEQALRDSETRYRLLFESNPYPVWVYDLETLSFLAVNHAAIDSYGFSREEFLTMTIKDIRPAQHIAALLDDVLQSSSETTRWRHRKKSGAEIDVE